VDQRPDPGDQQHETHRELVDLQPEVDLELADRDPAEHLLVDEAVVGRAAEQLREQAQAHPERREGGGAAQPMPPPVGASPAEQQDCGARQRQGDQQPGVLSHVGVFSL
jgi:hypothetical protein